MKLNMTCKTCEFGSNESCCAENSKKSHQDDTECGDWGASLEYFSEIIDNAPWYIKEPYRRCLSLISTAIKYLDGRNL